MSCNKSLLLYACLLSASVSVIARSTTGNHYHSITNRRLSGSLFTPMTGSSAGSSASSSTLNKDNHFDALAKPSNSQTTGESSIWNDFSLFYKVYRQCSKEDLTVCLKIKLLAGLDKASRSIKEFSLISGIKFVKDDSAAETAEPPMSENEIVSSLPRALDAKDETLNSMILSKIESFVKSHTLQVKFDDSDDSEGRGKKKKHGALIMIPLLLAGTFVPIAYGALALLAGKALIVSKLALVLASIIGIKKLLSGSQHKESEVVVSGHSSSGWGRDFDLAYSAYAPKEPSKTE